MNKLINDDCFKVMGKMEPNSIDLIITDPPYILATGAGDGGRIKNIEKIRHGLSHIADGFNVEKYFIQTDRILKKFNMFMFCSNKQISAIMAEGEKRGYITTLLVWHKTNCVPFTNGTWKSDLEFIIHIRENGATINGDSKLKSKIYISPCEVSKFGHPTEKPTKLIDKFIKVGSNKGDIILDTFMGSGTTPACCVNNGRNYIGIELNNKYFNIAKQRVQKANGNVGLFA